MSKRTKKSHRRASSDTDDDHDEPGAWECTVCTFRNKFESFKCEMCDSRKGTSTRKPRLNTNVVERQQLAQSLAVQRQHAAEKQQALLQAQQNSTGTGATAPVASSSSGKSEGRKAKSAANAKLDRLRDDSRTPPPAPQQSHSRASSHHDPSPSTSKSGSGKHSASNHAPAVSPPKLKGVDRNSARTLAVTVKGSTIVVTDYQLKSRTKQSRKDKGDKSESQEQQTSNDLTQTKTSDTNNALHSKKLTPKLERDIEHPTARNIDVTTGKLRGPTSGASEDKKPIEPSIASTAPKTEP